MKLESSGMEEILVLVGNVFSVCIDHHTVRHWSNSEFVT